MPPPTALQIASRPSGPPLTPAQKRFNTLVRQIEQARQALAAWHENIDAYRAADARVLQPLRAVLLAKLREWACALDAAAARPGWTKAERATLCELACEAARPLLEERDDDTEIKALFDRNADVDFDTEQRESAQLIKDMAEAVTGLDLGDGEALDEEQLFERLDQGLRQPEAEREEARAARAAGRRKSAAQQRREGEAQQSARSIREIFRKLASALHPDRETDAGERAAKTALMQRVNQAYAANDLPALLELQLQIEQIDASHIAGESAGRLKHYNQVLAEQLEELRAEIERVEIGWRMEFGVSPFVRVEPRKLGQVLREAEREWRAELAAMGRDLRMLASADAAAVKRWLKAQRKRLKADLD